MVLNSQRVAKHLFVAWNTQHIGKLFKKRMQIVNFLLVRESEFLSRWEQVLSQINKTGTYKPTSEELEFGSKLAWRNHSRCAARIQWNNLVISPWYTYKRMSRGELYSQLSRSFTARGPVKGGPWTLSIYWSILEWVESQNPNRYIKQGSMQFSQ